MWVARKHEDREGVGVTGYSIMRETMFLLRRQVANVGGGSECGGIGCLMTNIYIRGNIPRKQA